MKAISKIFFLFTVFIVGSLLNSANSYGQCRPPTGPEDAAVDEGPSSPDWSFDVVTPGDPNEIISPAGYDTARWVSIKDNMGFTVLYENDPKIATSPAHDVFIYYPIDEHQQESSFRLGNFGFNKEVFSVPPNTSFYYTRLDLRDSLGLYVDVTAGIDVVNNRAFWIFESIDPVTGLSPVDPMLGFLPVKDSTISQLNDTTPADGEGFVNFSMKPKATSQTRDTIFATAQIVFDTEDTIRTNTEFNTLDALPPVSSITASPVVNNTVMLHFNAADDPDASGVKSYDLYVAQDSTNFITYLTNQTTADISFEGVSGSQYHFFSLATDNTGNREGLKAAPDLTVSFTGTTNNPPVITLNGNPVASISLSGCSADTIPQCLVVTEPDNNPVTYSQPHPANHGTAILSDDASGVCVKYLAQPAYSGEDSLMLTACDGGGECDSLWIYYTITAASAWYADADNDGFGSLSVTQLACTQPAGYITNHTDCNDTDSLIHPGGVEVCNGLDDNCNGQTDEGVLVPAAATAISGPSKVCAGQTGFVYTVPTINAASSYSWTLPSGMTPASGGVITAVNSITVTLSAGFVSGSIRVRGINNCGNGALSPAFSVSKYSAVAGTPTAINGLTGGAYGFCGGNTYTFTTTSTNVSVYNWTASAGTIVSGAGTNMITLTLPSVYTSSVITVSATNCLGTSINRVLTVYGNPAQPSYLSGPALACPLGTYTYSVTAIPAGATSLTWTLPAGASLAGASGTTANITFGASFTSGIVRVAGHNGCGDSNPRSLTVSITPSQPGTLSGQTAVCKLTNPVETYSIPAVANASNYTWSSTTASVKFNDGVNPVSNPLTTTAISVSVNFAAVANGARNVRVSANSSCGSSAMRSLNVSVSSCRAGVAEPEVIPDEVFAVYPNPASRHLSVQFNSCSQCRYALKLIDELGRIVIEKTGEAMEDENAVDFNIASLAKGMYTIQLITSEATEQKRVMIQ